MKNEQIFYQADAIMNISETRSIILRREKSGGTMKKDINEILRNWDLENQNITQIHDTTWQIGDEYILKIYDNLDTLERNLKVLSILDAAKIPVGRTISTKCGGEFVKDENEGYFLSKKLPGGNIGVVGNNTELMRQMGKIIANLHVAFHSCEQQEEFWNNSLLEEMTGWVKEALERDGWNCINQNVYEQMVTGLKAEYEKLSVQLIHRDVHFGNFLFQEGEFSGYIDFDLSQRNIRIFDLCYFLLGLLSEEEKLKFTREQWFDFVKMAFEGYEEQIVISEEEKRAVPYVMEAIELIFVAYFLEIKNEGLAQEAKQIFEFVKEQEERIWSCIA